MKKIKLIFEQAEVDNSQLNRNLEKVADKLSKEKGSEITRDFVSEMVRTIIEKITVKLEQLDVSLDYISAALMGTDAQDIGVRQRAAGRFTGKNRAGAEQAAGQGKPSKGM